MLRTVWINPGEAEYERITKLLPVIFPKEELMPQNIADDLVPYLCFYEDGTFIGFAQVLKTPELHYLRYMAILPEFRSCGYGGKMLDMILAERGKVPLALDVEPPDETAANAGQRVRRINFYLKHGMVDTGYIYEFGGNPFIIMSTGESSVPELMRKKCAEDTRFAPGYVRIYKRRPEETR